MEILFSRYKRTEQVADLMTRAGAKVRSYAMPAGEIDLLYRYTEDGMMVCVYIEESGPLKLNCNLLETFDEEEDRALQAFREIETPSGVTCALENGGFYMEMTVDRQEQLVERSRFFFQAISRVRSCFLRMLDGMEGMEELPSELVRRVLQEENQTYFADRFQGGGWDFYLYDPVEMMDVFIGPDGYGFTRFCMEEELPVGLWPKIPGWLLEMSMEEIRVELTLKDGNWTVSAEGWTEFMLAGEEWSDRDMVRFSMEEATEKCRVCRKKMEAFLAGAV